MDRLSVRALLGKLPLTARVHQTGGYGRALAAPLALSHYPSTAPGRAAPAGGAWGGTRLRPGLSAKPSRPCARNRRTHLYTKRRLIPTVAATAEIDMPSATSTIIRPRRTRPAGIVGARCHARRVWRTAGVRRIEREVVRPRAILIPHRQENMGPVSPCQQG